MLNSMIQAILWFYDGNATNLYEKMIKCIDSRNVRKELIYLPEKLDFSRSGHQSLFQFHNPLRQPQSDSSKIRFCGRWHAAEAAETTILSKGSTSWCLHGLWHGRGRWEAVMVTCADNKDYCTGGCQIFYGINLLGDFWYGTPMARGVHGIIIQLKYRIKRSWWATNYLYFVV